MAHSISLNPDLQQFLDKYMEIYDKLSTLCICNEKQRQFLILQNDQLTKMKDKMRNITGWLIKREEKHKTSLDCLKQENEKLQQILADMQRKRGQIELLNSTEKDWPNSSKLQDEVKLLHIQVAQLKNKHKEQLILQDRHHKNEISKYKNLLEEAKLSSMRNIARKYIKKHPAFMIDEEEAKRKNLEAIKITRRKRKLFQEDDAVVDII